MNGSVVHVVELLGALAERDDVRVRALLPTQIGADAARALERIPALERLVLSGRGRRRRAYARRPPAVAGRVGRRHGAAGSPGECTVLTHQDLIGYRTPDVFGSVDAWQDYRATTVDALGLAAMVLFFSEAAAHDAAAEDLVTRRTCARGADRRDARALGGDGGIAPSALTVATGRSSWSSAPGSVTRTCASRWSSRALRDEHGWDGELVLAGGDVLNGSGTADDAAWLLRAPSMRARSWSWCGEPGREGVAAGQRRCRRLPEHL